MKFFSKNRFFNILAVLSIGLVAACSDSNGVGNSAAQQADSFVEVWKTPSCGCCSAWVSHLEENGFTVKVNDVDNTDSFRAALGMPQEYGSCHSARVNGYAVEGHVPADDIKKLLAEKPDAVGLAVPAMPMGSPGMEHPDFPEKRAEYDVLLVKKGGAFTSYTHYDAVN
ncbi:DUF411 domain-containing protein [Limnobacter parvus]|uniref:DUF411 domain-containing protein n=1 Tax=Limnobacter parvus TaxID=2939690 RepID=A0ABT1XF55_9BURK|nr:DUF411 domain-containing protein [Limnobacter parvus]MCR2745910.1 DUF411 domain-containing protein [Limnobacter parvus]